MSKYHVAEAVGRFFILMDTDSNKFANHLYFNGYDDMGSVNWKDRFSFDCALETREEAEQIIRDLEAGDEQDSSKREYLLKTVCEGIKQASVKTGKQIADIYEMDQIAGIFSSIEVWDLDSMKRISLLDLVNPILEHKARIEQEYRDYCENEEC